MTRPGCPEQPILEKILLGQLKGAEAELWEEHLANCPCCVETLAGLDSDDLLTAYLRKNRAGPAEAGDPIVRPLIEQMKKLLPPASRIEDGGSRVEDRIQSANLEPIHDPQSSILHPQSSIRDATGTAELPRLAQYRVLKKLGQGGMGMVFLAEDQKLHRLVALKVMLPEKRADPENRQRFLREARAAAAIKNERIVTIYQVDEDNGIPFLAMELLEGESLEHLLRRQPGPCPATFIIDLGKQIAEGLQAAHQVGFIHRDIKPSNIWLEAGRVVSGGVVSGVGQHIKADGSNDTAHDSRLTTHDSRLTTHQVKILDFGLARVVRAATPLTQSGMIVGTPGFLSPEQAAGRSVDARSDLFSLGVVLYLLATGTMPFAGDDVLAILTALAVEHPRPIFERNPDLPEGLAHLIMRLLSKQPEMRPASAAEVIAILQAMETKNFARDCDTEKLPARSVVRSSGKRRWLGWACGISAALVLAVWFLSPLLRRPDDSEAKDDANLQSKLPNPQDSKGKDGTKLQSKRDVPPVHVPVLEFEAPVHCAVFSPDGKQILAGGEDRKLRVWDVATGKEVRQIGQFLSPVRCVAFADHGRLVVTGTGHHVSERKKAVPKECGVQVWNFEDSKEVARFDKFNNPVTGLAISEDGRHLMTCGGRDFSRLFDLPGRRELAKFGDINNASLTVAISPNGKWGMFVGRRSSLCLVDLEKADEVRRFQATHRMGEIRCLQFAPNNRLALTCGRYFRIDMDKGEFIPFDCSMKLWDLETETELKHFTGQGSTINSCCFSPDGRYLLSGGGSGALIKGKIRSFDCSVRFWDVESGKELACFEGHTRLVQAVAISPDGRLGLSVSEDRTVRLWDLTPYLKFDK